MDGNSSESPAVRLALTRWNNPHRHVDSEGHVYGDIIRPLGTRQASDAILGFILKDFSVSAVAFETGVVLTEAPTDNMDIIDTLVAKYAHWGLHITWRLPLGPDSGPEGLMAVKVAHSESAMNRWAQLTENTAAEETASVDNLVGGDIESTTFLYTYGKPNFKSGEGVDVILKGFVPVVGPNIKYVGPEIYPLPEKCLQQ